MRFCGGRPGPAVTDSSSRLPSFGRLPACSARILDGRTSACRKSYDASPPSPAPAFITPRTALNVVVADPDDNRILECAVDCKADIIVSNDHHLLDLRTHAAIPVVAGVDFRRILGVK